MTAAERPGRSSQGALLAPESGTVKVQFRDLHGRLYAGVAWGWEEVMSSSANPASFP